MSSAIKLITSLIIMMASGIMDYAEIFEYCKKDCNKDFKDINEIIQDISCNFCDIPYIILLNEQNNKKHRKNMNTKK